MKNAIVLLGLGTPPAANANAIRPWLREFLSDTRVVGLPRWLWLPILHCFILPFRPAKVAKKYAKVWLEDGSPLLVYSLQQAQGLQKCFPESKVVYAERYGQYSISKTLDNLQKEKIEKITFFPLFPQYSSATTAAVNDEISRWMLRQAKQPEVLLINSYPQHSAYIDALASKIGKFRKVDNGLPRKLLISFHSVPCQQVARGDDYYQHCQITAILLAEKLQLSEDAWELCFQSRFSRGQWLGPDTLTRIEEIAREGKYSVDVVCPGFLADCLETLWDMGIEAKEIFEKIRINSDLTFNYLPCLNDESQAIEAFAQIIKDKMTSFIHTANTASAVCATKIKKCCGLCKINCG